MSHHSDELTEEMRENARRFHLGETGQFPDGKLNDIDQGEIQIGVAYDPKSDRVIINFGKEVAWVGMTPEQANALSDSLIGKCLESRGVK